MFEFLVFWILCAVVGAMIGSKKSRAADGFVLGLILGPFGVIIVALMKGNRKSCPYCRELVDKDAAVCPHCQKHLFSWRESQPQNAPTRKCPFCAEFIKKQAIVCRFCGRDLPSETEEFFEACKKGQKDKVKELLEAGFDVNARDKDGVTPLIIAVMSGNLGVVELLLKKGADLDMENSDGKTALQLVPAGESRIAELIREIKGEFEKARLKREVEERQREAAYKKEQRLWHILEIVDKNSLLIGVGLLILAIVVYAIRSSR